MKKMTSISLGTVEKLLKDRTPPFDFPSAKDCRSALNRLKKDYMRCTGVRNISEIIAEPKSIDALMARIERTPPVSTKERKQRSNMATRLYKLTRLAADGPTYSEAWAAFEMRLREIEATDQLAKQALIPIRSTLKTAALEDNLDPGNMTTAWISGRMQRTRAKRRESFRDAARLIDSLYDRLPPGLRPVTPFGDLSDTGGGNRRAGPLPPTLEAETSLYIDSLASGSLSEGLRPDRLYCMGDGIKSGVSTTIYKQAMGWYIDSLRVSGAVAAEDLPKSLIDAASLGWLAKVGFQSIEDYHAHEQGEATLLPWRPIKPITIKARAIALRKIFRDVRPDFNTQTVPKVMANGSVRSMNAEEVIGIISHSVDGGGMTDANRRFCLALLSDPNRQSLLLNMHTICWNDAQSRWARWDQLEPSERRYSMEICVLAAILAVVVHYPFRARTITEMTIGGYTPDVILPARKNTIDFAIFRDRMKVPKDFEAMLEDTPDSQPRKILDWFIAGPREMLLKDPSLLNESHREPGRLFGGFTVARYGTTLAEWSEMQGMRMTTHTFRHALATILVNLCDARLDDVALMLGNTREMVEHHYVLIDGLRRRTQAVARLSEYRKGLNNVKHPGRPSR